MSEFEWIEKYLKPLAKSAEARGLADDVASLVLGRPGRSFIVTMDTLVQGVHFLKDDPPYTLGKKLLRVNVSDILCKGAIPRQALLSLSVPVSFAEEDFAQLCRGLGEDLLSWNIDLIGGDLVSTPGPLTLTVTLTGECEGTGPVGRAGAGPAEDVFVSGVVGAGHLGLQDVLAGRSSRYADHYRVPEISNRNVAGLVARFASASIDLSDGLLADAGHVSFQSHVCVDIELDQVPWAVPSEEISDMLRLAAGGDDYQVLMTIRSGQVDAFKAAAEDAGVSVHRIGQTSGQGEGVRLSCQGKPVALPENTGFDHRKH